MQKHTKCHKLNLNQEPLVHTAVRTAYLCVFMTVYNCGTQNRLSSNRQYLLEDRGMLSEECLVINY